MSEDGFIDRRAGGDDFQEGYPFYCQQQFFPGIEDSPEENISVKSRLFPFCEESTFSKCHPGSRGSG